MGLGNKLHPKGAVDYTSTAPRVQSAGNTPGINCTLIFDELHLNCTPTGVFLHRQVFFLPKMERSLRRLNM